MITLVELGAIACGLGWLASYLLMIRQAHVDRVPAMPFIPLCINIAWELVFGFLLPDPAPVAAWINRAWFAVDCVLLVQLLRYGACEVTLPVAREWFAPAVFASIAIAITGICTFTLDTSDWGGNYTGWGDQVLNSIAFICMLARRRSSRGQSLYIVLFRSLGTLPLIPFQLTITPDSLFVPFTWGAYLLFDAAYSVMLYRQCRAEGRNPWQLFGRAPAATQTELQRAELAAA